MSVQLRLTGRQSGIQMKSWSQREGRKESEVTHHVVQEVKRGLWLLSRARVCVSFHFSHTHKKPKT